MSDLANSTNETPASSRASSLRRSALFESANGRPLPLYDVFLILKFPPSSSNHPLNAQISLVNQNAVKQSHSNRASGEWSRDGSTASAGSGVAPVAMANLERTPSILSYRSTGSSNASSSGGAPSSRKTTPLYNLEFHKIRETVVLDAQTDGKIARFMKKCASL